MSNLIAECRWPPLPPRYAAALREAVAFVLERFDVEGVVATGTIVRGAPHASSDLDLYVVHRAPFRQRVQRFFGGVPAEIFVNPPAAIRGYFEEEHRDARPLTAHMLATGAVVLARGPAVGALRAEAAAWLARPSYPSDAEAVRARYGAATRYEDAVDVVDTDPATAAMLLGHAVTAMLELHCRAADGRVPRAKDLLGRVAQLDPVLGALAARAFSDAPLAERQAAAAQVADWTIGARGFFAWDSGPEPVGETSG